MRWLEERLAGLEGKVEGPRSVNKRIDDLEWFFYVNRGVTRSSS